MQQELEIDPSNAGAEYVLGELAQQNQQWDEAIRAFFTRSQDSIPPLATLLLAGEVALVSAKRFSEAIAPLETAVKLEPGESGSALFAGDRIHAAPGARKTATRSLPFKDN